MKLFAHSLHNKQAKTTTTKKEKGQKAKGGVDLALASMEDALEMAENKELTYLNYIFLGRRFNFGVSCLGRAGNKCKCSSTKVPNACQRTNAIDALTPGAVAGTDCKLNLTILLLPPLNVTHLILPTPPS